MKQFHFKLLILLVGIVGAWSTRINYAGYQIVRVYPENEEQWKATQSLQNLGAMQVLRNPKYIDLLMPPNIAGNLVTGMKESGLRVEIGIQDVQKEIDSQKVNTDPLVNGSLEWDRYYPLTDIHQFFDDQASLHNSIASTTSIGTTYEGRDQKVLKISKSNETRPAVWLDANIHAREWITGAVCTYIVDQLLNSGDPEIESWLDEYDFYVLCITNPDGYEYTHTTDRFWRKSRSHNDSPIGCLGTDLNRNFDFHWLENGGASDDPCSDVYGGTAPFSDKESQNMRDFLTSISNRLVFYLSLHSAGQYILIPTGFSADRIPQYNTYMAIGRKAAEAHARRYGTIFTPGSVYDEMYVATGSSMDWVKDSLKTNLTITYELRDKGQYGHLLPPEQILPSALEFMDGLKVLMSELSKGIPEVDP